MNEYLKSTLMHYGITFTEIPSSEMALATYKKKKALFVSGYTPLVPYNIGLILSNKSFVKALLHEKKIPITRGKTFSPSDTHQATQYVLMLTFPVILRQENSQRNERARKNILNMQSFKKEFLDLAKLGESILVEEQKEGVHCKVFVRYDGWIQVLQEVESGALAPISSFREADTLLMKQPIYRDATIEFQARLHPIAKKILSVFSPIKILSFDCVIGHGSPGSLVVTEVYHSVSDHFAYDAVKGKQKVKVIDLVCQTILEVFNEI
jgi:hypothetical protein